MKRILDEQWDDELVFATTTIDKLLQATGPSDKIWNKIETDGIPESMSLKGLVPLV